MVDVGLGTESPPRHGPRPSASRPRPPQMAIVNPNLKELPVYKTREQVEAEQKAAPSRPPRVPVPRAARARRDRRPRRRSRSARSRVLPLAYRDGATRLTCSSTLRAPRSAPARATRLAIVARDADGKRGRARRRGREAPEDARRTSSPTARSASCRATTTSPPSSSTRPARCSSRAAGPSPCPALPTEFAASPLVVAVNDFPSDAPKPDDPFTFSARRFVVKGDGKLDASDGLSYAVRIYNPPVDPVVAHGHAPAHDQAQAEGPARDRRPDAARGAAEGAGGEGARARSSSTSRAASSSRTSGSTSSRTTTSCGSRSSTRATQKKLDLVAPFTVVGIRAPRRRRPRLRRRRAESPTPPARSPTPRRRGSWRRPARSPRTACCRSAT